MRILLAEDEELLAKALKKILEKNNYTVDVVFNGEDALYSLEIGQYDAAILDIMMPKKDGISVLKETRAKGNEIPIMMLTAKSEIDDKVLGFDSGANDYLTKPFDSKELLARLRNITRIKGQSDNLLKYGNIVLDQKTFELSSPFGNYRLTNKEYQIMEYLMSDPHILISSEQLLEKIWSYDEEASINVVWVYISYLRKKLKALNANIKISASRNSGYFLEIQNDQ